MKLLTRTVLIFLLYASVVAAGGTWVYYNVIHKLYYAYVDRTLSRRKLRVLKDLRLYLRSPADLAYWHQLDHNIEFRPLKSPAPPDRFSVRPMYNELTGLEQPYRQLATPITFQGRPYELQMRISLLDTQLLLARIVGAGVVLFGVLVLGLLGLQFLLTRQLWAPFYHTLEQLRRYQLDQSKPVVLAATNVREFQELNLTLDQLLTRNQRAYLRQKQFTENAAHELQTPLAILRTKLDLLVQAPGMTEEQAGHLEGLFDVTHRLTHLSRNLLLLARLENEVFFPTETVDVAAATRTQLRLLTEQFEASDLTVETELAANAPLRVNRGLLDVLLSNLLANAIRHNHAGGRVHVQLTPTHLIIENTGRAQALSPDSLFQRFSKDAGSRPGSTGLGLAIVRQICDTCGFPIRYSYPATGLHRLEILLT